MNNFQLSFMNLWLLVEMVSVRCQNYLSGQNDCSNNFPRLKAVRVYS